MKIIKVLTVLITLVFFSTFIAPIANAHFGHEHLHIGGDEDNDEDDTSEDIEDLEDKIAKLEKKLEETKSKGKTLQREIESFNSQISLTQLRIQQSLKEIEKKEKEIARLGTDIDDLRFRIDKLIDSISVQEEIINERIRARYKTRESSPVIVLFGSDTLTKIIQKAEYLKVMEKQDKRLLDQMNKTKKAYGLQKNLFEDKKAEEEELKAQLEVEKANLERYNADLERQKGEKNALLVKTQNDEKKFQQQLEDAQRELNQILSAVSALMDQEPRDVDKGELIGIQGNTGYSFGEHLHFGVYKYSSFEDIVGWNWYYSNHVNPSKKLKKKDVYWNTGCEGAGTRTKGDGDWEWPIKNPTISQGYGYTCWSNIYYNGNPHPAYDMYGNTGSPVYAAEDGKAYFCKNCLGDGGNGVFIFHDNGYMTLYWHLK